MMTFPRQIVPERAVPAILVLIFTLALARGAPNVFGQVAQTVFDPPPASLVAAPQIIRTLGLGSTDATTAGEVSVWQTFLVREAKGPAATALKAAFDRGVKKGYFGGLTGKATEEWQAAKGITPTYPAVGPKTRAAITGGAPPPAQLVRVILIDASTNQPIAIRQVRLEQQIACATTPCVPPFLEMATDARGVLAVSPTILRSFSMVVVDGFERYAFTAPPAADTTVRLNNLSANFVTARSVEATYDKSVQIGETDLVSWTMHFPGVTNLSGYYAVIGLLGGPTQGGIGIVPAVTGSARENGVFSWQVRTVTQDDIVVNIEPGAYRVSVGIYDGLPCVQSFCDPATQNGRQNGRLIASDETDATFTIIYPLPAIEEQGILKVKATPEYAALIARHGSDAVSVKAVDYKGTRAPFLPMIHSGFEEVSDCIIVVEAPGGEGYVYQLDEDLNVVSRITLAAFRAGANSVDAATMTAFYSQLK